jgi:hypothetical protein
MGQFGACAGAHRRGAGAGINILKFSPPAATPKTGQDLTQESKMESFSTRLGKYLAAHKTDRRGGMFVLLVFVLFSGFVGFKGFMIIFGLCLLAEGIAMLLTADLPEEAS